MLLQWTVSMVKRDKPPRSNDSSSSSSSSVSCACYKSSQSRNVFLSTVCSVAIPMNYLYIINVFPCEANIYICIELKTWSHVCLSKTPLKLKPKKKCLFLCFDYLLTNENKGSVKFFWHFFFILPCCIPITKRLKI